jgi:hypothetical protein
MTTEQFTELMTALRGIQTALEARQVPIPLQSKAIPAAGPVLIPMPTQIVPDAQHFQIHFGKNKGRELGTLSAKSLEWYAADKPPQLRNDGTPFPPRSEDIQLLNAARTLHHRLGAAAPVSTVATLVMSPTTDADDNLPF